MNVICVDDEFLSMRRILSMCLDMPEVSHAEGFTSAAEALAWLKDHTADVALLDIHMPDMNGLALAEEIRKRRPHTAIIFVTAHSQYAIDAFALHVSGYLLKPVSKERLSAELAYAASARPSPACAARIKVQTFGYFEIMADGKRVAFKRSKSKELLALLVDKRGGGMSRSQAQAELWEDRDYDRQMQKQFDVILRSLRSTLREYGIGEILELQRGFIRIRPELLNCDLYCFLDGDKNAAREFRGEYMTGYSWGRITEGYLSRLL
ncbi:MAG: response regulator [Oscillibacter sp.]|nr:response regulator [Oscillibacter sp.]